jgi:predicted enzyme related to lactoylglutathione lyase
MTPPRLAHVFVFTSNLERMAGFYAAALGLRREDSADAGFVIMRANRGADVALHRLPPHIAATIAIDSPPAWREETALKICFATDDVVAQRGSIVAHGGQAKAPWSSSSTDFCECADPEGNVIQIFQRGTSWTACLYVGARVLPVAPPASGVTVAQRHPRPRWPGEASLPFIVPCNPRFPGPARGAVDPGRICQQPVQPAAAAWFSSP